MTARRDGTPPFTPKQAAAIRKVARRHGIRAEERQDFVHDVWLEVHRCHARVPSVEPDRSKYLFRMARNIAVDMAKKRADDVLFDATPFSELPLDTPLPATLAPDDAVLARELLALAIARDAEGADWLVRAKVEGDVFPEIALETGQPLERVKKRVGRLAAWLREQADACSVPD